VSELRVLLPIVEEVLRRYPDKVKLEFHHYPLIQMHAHALAAAMAPRLQATRGNTGKCMTCFTRISRNGPETQIRNPSFLPMPPISGWMRTSSCDRSNPGRRENGFLKIFNGAASAKVEGTPSFYINGQALNPLPKGVDDFAAIIESTPQAAK
jgi:hypothetical protein